MAKNLVIVESPAKAKTIEGFLGKDFEVKSCYGHVRDLPKKGVAIDVENNFLPTYEVSPDKRQVIAELKKLCKQADIVWLASDEDREGEAISWHLKEVLKLDDSKTKRIVFNEITKTAIQKAIDNPREIDNHLVDAQQARRVLDRLVGFELSPVLWRKIKPSLSAGRVQSVAVRLTVEREKEILAFKSVPSFKVIANFLVKGKTVMKADLGEKFQTKEEAEKFLNDCKEASFTIKSLEKKPAKKTPSAPFTTSTLQQEASRKLSFSVAQTMMVAQRLYEAGKITYMRTDSVNLSQTALDAAKEEITKNYGAEYSRPKNYVSKNKGAQEAHEAIRPTYMENQEASSDYSEQRLYELIWKRTIASQMADAQLERTTVNIEISNREEKFVAKGEVIKFDGFLKVYMESTDDDNAEDENTEGLIPPLNIGEELSVKDISATERFSKHPPRFTEASLVKKLEELGIGRPSTYAPTISTIQKRGYVIKEDREGKERKYHFIQLAGKEVKSVQKTEITGTEKSKLFPTDIGIVVNDFLIENFEDIMNYNFTAEVEKEFDDIAKGQLEWNKMIEKFYSPFHKGVEDTLETAERASGERELGNHPENGKRIIARIGKFGPMVQIGEANDEDKPKFASLLKNQSIGTITLEEALDLFKLPRDVGEYEGKKVVAAIGRFGPYIRHDGKFASLEKGIDDPMTVNLERAIELIEAKRKADREKFIKSFEKDESVQILNGRWGPYIKIGKKNYKIPKDTEPKSLTLEQCLALAKEQDANKGKKRTAKKKK